MKHRVLTSPGTIREKNQDYFLNDDSLNAMVLVDGYGPKGISCAEAVARSFLQKLRNFSRCTHSEDVVQRYETIISQINEEIALNPDFFANSGYKLTGFWVIDGKLSGVSTGSNLALMISADGTKTLFDDTASKETPSCFFDLNISDNHQLLMMSEGLKSAWKEFSAQLNLKTPDLKEIFTRLSDFYDGDDRTLILSSFSTNDIKRRTARDIVLHEDFNREFTFKLWQPIAFLSGLSFVSSIFGLTIFYKLYKKFWAS